MLYILSTDIKKYLDLHIFPVSDKL
jgi:hypothetical protein